MVTKAMKLTKVNSRQDEYKNIERENDVDKGLQN